MYFTSSLLVAALLGVAQAQTPSGFKPEVKAKLDVMFNSTAVSAPGKLLTKAETGSQPQIAVAGNAVNGSGMYMFVMMDLDVPGQGTNTTRRVLLHAMNTGFKASSQKISSGSTLLTSTEKGPAAYIAPGPPATDTMPHRYVEMLFAQPDDLAVKATDFADTSARIGFDLDSFMTKNKLGMPLAANFFTVDGKASAASTPARSGSAGMPKSTAAPFTGSARAVDFSLGLAGVLGGLVVAAI
ncbi:PEBP-like protein [Massarina eburnea CBS 473.64]|uniref:PEBP-like protein n=1 Tax=Massarina eburnea CBS 473.64 TaxID=1395130 RepID=A0A6A6SGW0_9PLEO|nr:PEBP-like protein [Massarina eburnea CBS 473.64]